MIPGFIYTKGRNVIKNAYIPVGLTVSVQTDFKEDLIHLYTKNCFIGINSFQEFVSEKCYH